MNFDTTNMISSNIKYLLLCNIRGSKKEKRKKKGQIFGSHIPTYPNCSPTHIILPSHSLSPSTKWSSPSFSFSFSHKHNTLFHSLAGAHLTTTFTIFLVRFTRKIYRKKISGLLISII